MSVPCVNCEHPLAWDGYRKGFVHELRPVMRGHNPLRCISHLKHGVCGCESPKPKPSLEYYKD